MPPTNSAMYPIPKPSSAPGIHKPWLDAVTHSVANGLDVGELSVPLTRWHVGLLLGNISGLHADWARIVRLLALLDCRLTDAHRNVVRQAVDTGTNQARAICRKARKLSKAATDLSPALFQQPWSWSTLVDFDLDQGAPPQPSDPLQ